MSSEQFLFMLPSLLTDGLAEDDSAHYSFLTFARGPISEATKIIIETIGKDASNVSITSKKRVKVLMEFFGVGLTLNIEQCKLMEIVVNYYEKWLVNSSLFGDIKRQNKYICRIIKQLSQPFAFRDPKSSSTFQFQFLPLLIRILSIYENLFTQRGQELELNTWITLLNVCIGVTDSILAFAFGGLCPEEKLSEFRQKAVNLLFSVILNSGIETESHWSRVIKYCNKWSNNNDFLTVWGERVNELWTYFNQITFKTPVNKIPISTGVFSEKRKITDKTASDFFHHVIKCCDYQKIYEKPDLLLTVAKAMAKTKDTAVEVANNSSKTFETNRYPAYSYLKLFGKFITCAPILPEAFDQAVAINVTTLFDIIAKFEFHGTKDIIPRFIAYITQRAVEPHTAVIYAFINNASMAYSTAGSVIPYISSASLDLLGNVQATKQIDENFAENFTTLFISAANSTIKYPDVIDSAFEHAKKICQGLNLRYRLLAACATCGVDVLSTIRDYCKRDKFIAYSNNPNFACALIALLSSVIRNDPSLIERVIKDNLIPLILSNVSALDSNKTQAERIIQQTLLMVYEIIEWAPSAFHLPENSNSLFEFLNVVNTICQAGRMARSASTTNAMMAQRESEKKDKADKHRHSLIAALATSVQARLALHSSPIEHITRKFCSSSMFSEQTIISHLNIKNPIIHYVTVGSNTLIAFIETKECKDPLAFFARGPFGKAAYMLADDYTNGKTPELSDEIQPTALPKAEPIKPIPLELYGEQPANVPYMSQAELVSVDDQLRKVYGDEFSKWTDWDKNAFYVPFNYKAPYQRLRIVDFLTTFGILDIENKNQVRPQMDDAAVKDIIKRFDLLDVAPIIPIPVIHFMAGDEDLKYKPEQATRMTTLMLNFLREIGQPMELSAAASDVYKLPVVNTTVPSIPFLTAFATLFTPGMGNTADDAAKIHKLMDDASIMIIFNESGFALNVPKNENTHQFVLVIKPLIIGLYQVDLVQAPQDVLAPFSHTQVLSAKSLSSYLVLCLELLVGQIQKQICPATPEQRGKLIKEICPRDKKYTELAPLSPGMFE